jgi:hypothetical protein
MKKINIEFLEDAFIMGFHSWISLFLVSMYTGLRVTVYQLFQFSRQGTTLLWQTAYSI